MTDEGVLKACASCGKSIDIGRPGNWVPVAAERAARLIVGKEEHDVGLSLSRFTRQERCREYGRRQQTGVNDEFYDLGHDISQWMGSATSSVSS